MYRYTKGDVDWSVHTKRMLADIKPRLMKKNAAPLKISEMTGLTAPEKKVSKELELVSRTKTPVRGWSWWRSRIG